MQSTPPAPPAPRPARRARVPMRATLCALLRGALPGAMGGGVTAALLAAILAAAPAPAAEPLPAPVAAPSAQGTTWLRPPGAAAPAPMPQTALPPAPGATTGAAPGPAAGAGETRHYDLYLGGIWLAELAFTTTRDGTRYRTGLHAATRGPLAAVYTVRVDARAEGRIRGDRWAPEAFSAETADARRQQAVAISFRAGRPVAVTAEPPFDPKPWEIPEGAHGRADDPLTAFLTAAEVAPGTKPCGRVAEITDGRRHHRISLGPARRDGAFWRCEAVWSRVAGFKPKQMKKPSHRADVWYREREDGGAEFLRAMAETPWGVAVLRRR